MPSQESLLFSLEYKPLSSLSVLRPSMKTTQENAFDLPLYLSFRKPRDFETSLVYSYYHIRLFSQQDYATVTHFSKIDTW